MTPIESTILQTVEARRFSIPEAVAWIHANLQTPMEALEEARTALAERASAIRAVQPAVTADAGNAWFAGPVSGGQWDAYRSLLKADGAPGLPALDAETSFITSLLACPQVTGDKRKGLVMGNVQSGKTRNFGGVVAKAADAGYKFVIVLSGMHNNLRDQTQSRLDSQLFDGEGWYPLTDQANDFVVPKKPTELFRHQKFLCAVVKKNVYRLARLNSMLKAIGPQMLNRIPILIVDDEADQATPNSLQEKNQVSAINRKLRELWKLTQTGTYVAYTATPFANVLIDPDNEADLFPSNFITTLEPGEGYFGAERVFGISENVDDGPQLDGLDMVRMIPTAEADSLRPPSDVDDRDEFDPDIPPSLRDAVNWFLVATAIRRARGQFDNSSMLVHTTHYTGPHFTMKDALDLEVAAAAHDLQKGDIARFEQAWQVEATRVASEATVPLPNWEAVLEHLEGVVKGARVIVDNGKSSDRLNYVKGEPQTVIAVGGGTLARGLTLEGLTVSYFTRTSNTYDTLLQMGRWFGYRTGYEDLPRVWVTEGLDKDYAFLARVEKDLRDEIRSVQNSGVTPAEMGVRVRAHPGRLEVTAKNKMFDANVVTLGLSGIYRQTFLLDRTQEENNRLAANRLLGEGVPDTAGVPGRLRVDGLSGSRVRDFVGSFRAHPDQTWLMGEFERQNMLDWIERWADGNVWNCVVVGLGQGESITGDTMSLAGHDVPCLNRTPLIGSSPSRLDMKAIMSAPDLLADIDSANYSPQSVATEAGRRRVRRLHGAGRGLVLLYPMSGHATAKTPADGAQPTRMDMPTGHPVLGFAIVFPAVNDEEGTEGTFISVRRHWDVPTAVEGDSDSALEGEGERSA